MNSNATELLYLADQQAHARARYNEDDAGLIRESKVIEWALRQAALRASAAPEEGIDWKDDPSADERWNAGCDFAMAQLCKTLGVEPEAVTWDAATETVDGDVRAVIGNIMRVKYGEDWGPNALPSDSGKAAPVAWRCFHCNEVFTDEEAAREHFGMDEEWEAGCIDQLNRNEKEHRRQQVQFYQELDAEREKNSELLTRDYVLSCWERDLAKYFSGAKSVHQAYLVLDAMEGRALAAEERAGLAPATEGGTVTRPSADRKAGA